MLNLMRMTSAPLIPWGQLLVIQQPNRLSLHGLLIGIRNLKYINKENYYLNNKAQKVYIDEHLTKVNAEIMKKARDLKRSGNIKDCWTFNCNMMVRTNDLKIVKLNDFSSLMEFDKVKESTSNTGKYHLRRSTVLKQN